VWACAGRGGNNEGRSLGKTGEESGQRARRRGKPGLPLESGSPAKGKRLGDNGRRESKEQKKTTIFFPCSIPRPGNNQVGDGRGRESS